MVNKFKYKKAIVLGGSKGIGKEIARKLKLTCSKVHALSSKDIDTSDLNSVSANRLLAVKSPWIKASPIVTSPSAVAVTAWLRKRSTISLVLSNQF